MNFEGTAIIEAPRDEVWRFVTDAEKVGPCLPGVQELASIEGTEDKFRMRVTADLGSFQPTFDLTIDFTVKKPPEEARLKVRGKGPNSFVGPVESERRRR